MISYADCIKTVNDLLKKLYPKIQRYGNDAVDKAIPPYFFVECVPIAIDRQSQNMLNKRCTMHITYVQKIPDQVENLEISETIWEALGLTYPFFDRERKVNRSLKINDYSHDYIGQNNNILQISFGLNWWESTEWIEGDPAETFEVAVKGD